MKYKAPKNKDGQIQHVAVVIKNKDCLISYLNLFSHLKESLASIMAEFEIDEETRNEIVNEMDLCLDSCRFNGYINDGINIDKLNKKDLEIMVSESIKKQSEKNKNRENLNIDMDDNFFNLTCACGNYYSFKAESEIPEKTFVCDLCDRVLIDYVGIHDHEIEYDKETKEK